MKMTLTQHTHISRYAGEYPSLSAFFLSAAPTIADTERVLTRGKGDATWDGETLLLDYTEERPEEGERHAVTLRYADGEVCIRRGGGEMRFRLRATTKFLYRVGLGALDTEAYTESIAYSERGDAGLLTLVYLSLIGGMVTRTELRFKLSGVGRA